MSRLKRVLALVLLVTFVGGISSCGVSNGLAKSKGKKKCNCPKF